MFYDILERKNAFLDYKNKNFKNSRNCHFSKGVNPWFLDRNGYLCNFFFLGRAGQENVFYDILKHKNACLGYKNKTILKSVNCHYSKGVNPWICTKMTIFFKFVFLRQYWPGKCLLQYSRTKKRFSRL